MPARIELLTYGFIALSLVSTGPLLFSSLNYLQFFPSLHRLELKIESNEVVVQESHVTLHVEFTIRNPTGYAGLRIRGLEPVLRVENSTGSVYISTRAIGVPMQETPLGPGSILRVDLSYNLWPQDAQTYISIGDKSSVVFYYDASVNLSTLLDKISRVSILYECQTQMEPALCRRVFAESIGVEPGLPSEGGV